ncbi:MAG: 50S ribosomal protein L32 [Candidatus Margulisiibacteriota bacterium]|jgi:large subunit ribosomal protein L32
MPVPKKRSSKSRRRSSLAQWKVSLPGLRPCPNCGVLGLSHFACKECGQYDNRAVIKLKLKKDPQKEV